MRAIADMRLDQWLVAHGYAATRDEAQAAIMAGDVTVDGVVIDKPGRRMRPEARVAVRRPERSFVGRGGFKLAHALAVFGIDPRGRTVVDLGASTGGFTDCLLQAGAARVYSVDVGRGQLAWRLRTDPRVVCLEGVNARYLTPAQVGGPADLVTADLSFISLRLIWRTITAIVRPGGDVVALIKPQFEAGRGRVGRRGVVRDPAVHETVLRGTLDAAGASGLVSLAVTASPVTGPAGNIEYFAHLRPPGQGRVVTPGVGDQEASRSGSARGLPRGQSCNPSRGPRGAADELAAMAPSVFIDLAAVVADAHARFPSHTSSRPHKSPRRRRRL